jgi:hypothetical protein
VASNSISEIKSTHGILEQVLVSFSCRTKKSVHKYGSHFEDVFQEGKTKDVINRHFVYFLTKYLRCVSGS